MDPAHGGAQQEDHSIASKMQNTLHRTARSGVINNGRDSSCCILTGDARLLCVGESLPIHVMVGTDAMARSMAEFHPDLRRGDAFLHNSPYHGCTHAADLSVLVPVVDDQGVHRFTVLAKAHQADIGDLSALFRSPRPTMPPPATPTRRAR